MNQLRDCLLSGDFAGISYQDRQAVVELHSGGRVAFDLYRHRSDASDRYNRRKRIEGVRACKRLIAEISKPPHLGVALRQMTLNVSSSVASCVSLGVACSIPQLSLRTQACVVCGYSGTSLAVPIYYPAGTGVLFGPACLGSASALPPILAAQASRSVAALGDAAWMPSPQHAASAGLPAALAASCQISALRTSGYLRNKVAKQVERSPARKRFSRVSGRISARGGRNKKAARLAAQRAQSS